jgi:trehalose/maltose hydrolase-like predicted phosphorylase
MLDVTAPTPRRRAPRDDLPQGLRRRFEAIVFDWDGTAVTDRAADATRLRAIIEELSTQGMHLAVVTGTHVSNVDRQLGARPTGPGRVLLSVNRGSELFEADGDGLRLLFRREATALEEAALDAAAAATVEELARRGIDATIVSQRLNRRKIDLIPLPEWEDPPKARISELLAAVETKLQGRGLEGLGDAVELATVAAHEAGLIDPRVTSDAKHVEIGITDKADGSRRLFSELWRTGVAPGLVLIVGDEFGSLGGLPGSDSHLLVPDAARATVVSVGREPTGTPPRVLAVGGGPAAVLAILEDQLARRLRWDVPDVDDDTAWSLTIDGLDHSLERVHESLLALGDGRLGTRGIPALGNSATDPAVVLAGMYEGVGPASELAHGPVWPQLADAQDFAPRRRRLDLRTGTLREYGPIESIRFSSFARPATTVLRASGPREFLPRGRRRSVGRTIRAAFLDRRHGQVFERMAAYDVDATAAAAALAAAEHAGFERLLGEHRRMWARRWDEADVLIEGDAELHHAVRVALFHLMGSVSETGEAAVGARGLTGSGYRGHVFWDSDVFVLPFLAATHPQAARAMLEYRVKRLPAAFAAARALGRSGARFPWESAADGSDVTPAIALLPTGAHVAIRTGEREEHIVADVAWAASHYLDWTGDTDFESGDGGRLIVETARYWASRIRRDGAGRAHIHGVIGPDEYHEPVDDNAYTNVMARWNLRRAARIAGVDDREREAWLEVADALVDGYDEVSGLYEQFAGFFDLEPIVIAEVAPRRPVAADLLLGAERAAGAQVLKQADVLMLHHLVPDEVEPDSLGPNLDFYEPRTAHGSSLSPAIHAALLARAGRYRAALGTLAIAARLDLDDLTGTTAAGVHLATMGGLWQALAFGFAGLRVGNDRLLVDPHLPLEWNALELGLRFRNHPFRLRIERSGLSVDSDSVVVSQTDGEWEVRPR